MAVGISVVGGTHPANDDPATLTFTPAANTTYLVFVPWFYFDSAGPPTVGTISFTSGGSNIGAGPMFIHAAENTDGNSTLGGMACWKFQAVASPSGTTTIQSSWSPELHRCKMRVYSLTDVDYTSLVVQPCEHGTTGTQSMTMDTPTTATNLVISAWVQNDDNTTSNRTTPPPSWTELEEIQSSNSGGPNTSNDDVRFVVDYIVGLASTTIPAGVPVWNGGNPWGYDCGMGLELLAGGGGATYVRPQIHVARQAVQRASRW